MKLLQLLCAIVLLVSASLEFVAVEHSMPHPSPTRFTEHLLKGDLSYSFGIAAADLDGDGDIDLTCADVLSKDTGKLYWMENDNRGNFKQHFIEKRYPHSDRLERHMIGDVDGDGKPDVVVIENRHGDVIWYKNSGTPAKDEEWQRHIIAKDAIPGAYDVVLGDLDGDGDLDAAVSTWLLGNQFVWFENPGKAAVAGPWKMHIIEEKIADTRMIRVGDFNRDGKPDLLGSARVAGQLMWYENPGDPRQQPWKKHIIDDKLPNAMHGTPVDIDGDGDLDVLLATGMLDPAGKVVWYENVGKPGAGTTWKQHLISNKIGKGFEAISVDLDGDGDFDVAVTAFGKEGQLVWFENPGDPTGTWIEHALKTNWSNPNQVIAADLNGDKRPDLIACAEKGSNEVRWWRNEGKGK